METSLVTLDQQAAAAPKVIAPGEVSGHGTYERSADGRVRYILDGDCGVDRVPAHLRDLAARDERVDVEPCESAPAGRILVRRVDPTVKPDWNPKVGVIRTARAVYRRTAWEVATSEVLVRELRAEEKRDAERAPLSDAEVEYRRQKLIDQDDRLGVLAFRRAAAKAAGFKSIGRAVRAGVLPR